MDLDSWLPIPSSDRVASVRYGRGGMAVSWSDGRGPTVWLGLALVCVAGLVACGGGSGGGTGDGGADGAGICRMDADCDDGLFCNGAERCAPDDPAADERGCIEAEAGPCSGDQRCDEGGDACLASCEVDPDADGDGQRAVACGGTDCDDTDPNRYAGNTEVCDPMGHDEDCDPTTFGFRDADGDGEPDARCCNEADDGTRYCGSDCDDARPSVGPTAAEACDGLDNDCDGETDEESLEPVTHYRDADGDGYGDPVETQVAYSCEPPDGFVATAGDCNDSEPHVYVGAPELCDGMDNDCSLPGGQAGGPDPSEDADDDGHAPGDGRCSDEPATEHCPPCDPEMAPEACDPHCLAERLLPADDCDDEDSLVHPDATERCDGLDNDCDGETDEGAGTGGEPDAWCGPAMACVSRPDAGGALQAWCEGRQRLATGGWVACAIVGPSNGVACWGSDVSGALGGGDADGDGEEANDDGPLPVRVLLADGSPLEDVVQVTVGSEHACALRRDGTVRCWGTGSRGELGDGVSRWGAHRGHAAPVCVSGSVDGGDCEELGGVAQVAAAATHTCAVLRDGRVRCWGSNDSGQLGFGAVGGVRATAVLVRDAGGPLRDAVQVAVGEDSLQGHSCARRRDGTVVCWGANDKGQIGDGTLVQRPRPTVVLLRAGGGPLDEVRQVVLGGAHTCVLLASGEARCWGDNEYGALGVGTIGGPAAEPLPVVGAADEALTGIAALAAGAATGFGAHTCARMVDGTVRCWGSNHRGQLGQLPGPRDRLQGWAGEAVAGLDEVEELDCGYSFCCARSAGGAVRCWGANASGQLGDGGAAVPRPVVGADGAPVRGVVMVDSAPASGEGGSHSCAVLVDGRVVCWGAAGDGLLGEGTVGHRVPHAVEVRSAAGSPLTSAVSVGVGSRHACVVLDAGTPGDSSDDTVQCWGENDRGQLGDGTRTNRFVPGEVPGLTGVVEVDGGQWHACARLADGGLRCWGWNNVGQVGDASTSPRLSPAVVSFGGASSSTSPFAGAVRLGLGVDHTCAIGNGGAPMASTPNVARCWGSNGEIWPDGTIQYDGRIGNGRLERYESSPQDVCADAGCSGSLTPVRSIDAGWRHTCASLQDGRTYCWGDNPMGELGGGYSGGYSSHPVTVCAGPPPPAGACTPLTGVRALTVGNRHACAVVDVGADGDSSNDEAWCWGRRYSIVLGRARNQWGTAEPIVRLSDSPLRAVRSVAAGGQHACAVVDVGADGDATNDEAWCWGDDGDGQLGRGLLRTVMGLPGS